MGIRLPFLLLAAAFVGNGPARAATGAPCASLYAQLYHETRSARYLTAADNQALDAVRADTTLSSSERAKRIFDIMLEARLRDADPEVANHVREVYRNAKVTLTKGKLNGGYNPAKGTMSTKIPESLADTSLDYSVRIHELQHAYQHQFLLERGASFRRFGTTKIMLIESDAISLEWNYLRQIPKADRQAIARLIEADAKINAKAKVQLVAALDYSDLGFQQYIDKMRELGRYSRTSLNLEAAQQYGTVGLAVAALAYKLYVQYGEKAHTGK